METVKNTVNYVSETVQQGLSATSKEANKQVAKDSNAPVSTRLSATGDAIGDKVDEKTHGVNADVHKEAAKH